MENEQVQLIEDLIHNIVILRLLKLKLAVPSDETISEVDLALKTDKQIEKIKRQLSK